MLVVVVVVVVVGLGVVVLGCRLHPSEKCTGNVINIESVVYNIIISYLHVRTTRKLLL